MSRRSPRRAATEYLGLPLQVPFFFGLGPEHLVPKLDWTLQALMTLLELRPGALLDIGANQGTYLLRLRATDDERAYYGFDPDPACALYIQQLIHLNGFANAKIYPFAFADRQAMAKFYSSDLGDKMGSLWDYFRPENSAGFDVMTFRGDDIVGQLSIDDIAVIKIDVEGAESQVVDGLRQTLTQHQPCLIIEILPPRRAEPRFSERHRCLSQLWACARQLDYIILAYRRAGGYVRVSDIQDIASGDNCADYVWVPASVASTVLAALSAG